MGVVTAHNSTQMICHVKLKIYVIANNFFETDLMLCAFHAAQRSENISHTDAETLSM